MNIKFEMETVREIWNDADKSCVEIGPDRDGLGLIEIRYREDTGKITQRISFPIAQARLLAIAVEECAKELANFELSKGINV